MAAARDAAGLLHRVHLAGGRLARTSRDGSAGRSAGVLDDYACVAEGFLALSGVTGEARWVTLAGQLLDTALDRFGDGSGGFYDTADDGEKLVYRPADPADGPTPSGAFAAAGALLSYAALSGSERHRAAAVAALGVLQPIAGRFPRAAGWGLAVAEALLSGPAEIAVVGPPGAAGTAELHRAALHAAPPGAVLALGDGSGPGNGGGQHRVAGRAGTGQWRPGRLRVPQLQLPGPGHRAGRAARRPGPEHGVTFSRISGPGSGPEPLAWPARSRDGADRRRDHAPW